MNWQKFLNLVKKTGDRLIVTDKDEGEAYVVMSLSEYESLISKAGFGREPNRDADEDLESFTAPESGMDDYDEYEIPEFENDDSKLSEEERFYLEPVE